MSNAKRVAKFFEHELFIEHDQMEQITNQSDYP